MTDSKNADPAPTEIYGNISVTYQPHEFTITHPAKRSLLGTLPLAGMTIFMLFESVRLNRTAIVALHSLRMPLTWSGVGPYLALTATPALFICLSCSVLLACVREIGGRREDVRCTHDDIEITNSDFGRIWRKRSFRSDDIQSIAFGAVSYSKFGVTSGLILINGGKRIKCAAGLKVVEAERVLATLRRFGFNAVTDPAMPMMVEMELSRRKGIFRWLH